MVHVGGAAASREMLATGDLEGFARLVAARRPTSAVAVGVRALDGIEATLRDAGVPLLIAGRDLPCPLTNRYPDPKTLGADRWVAALAAHRVFGDAIVVDCGTALTVDAVTAAGVFLGGCIAPGLRTMGAGLAARAPALPPLAPEAVPVLPAVTSPDAVNAGTILGFCGMVERLIDDLRAATGLRSARCALTGGEAPVFARHGRALAELMPDLVHQGLRWLSHSRISHC